MPRENSFSDSDGRSLTPDLDEEVTGGIAPSSPTYGNNRLSLPDPVEPYGVPQPQQTPLTDLPAIVTNLTSEKSSSSPPVAAAAAAASVASPGSIRSRRSTRSKRLFPPPMPHHPPMPPRERFQSVVRKVMAMHRGTSLMVTGLNVGAEPGIDPRRASADLMFGGIKKRCVIEMFDYSSTNCMAGKYTNGDFIRLLNHPEASKREPWVKVRWINIGGLSWDVIKAVSLKYDIHPLALEDVFHTRSQTRSKVDYYGKHLFLRILCHELAGTEDPALSSTPSSSHENITGGPRSSSPIPFNDDEDEDDRKKFMTDSETVYGGTVNSRWSLKKGGTLRSRTKQQTGGSEKDMEMGVLNKTRSNDSWSFFDSGDRVQVQVQPMFIFLFRDGTVISMQNSTDLSITQPISQRIQQRDTGLRTSADPSMLVQGLLDLIVDKALEVIDEYHHAINRFEARVLLNPSMETVRNLHILSGDLILHKRTLEPIKTLVYGLRRYDLDRAAALVDTSLSANKDVKIVGYMSHKSKIYLADVYDHMEYILSSVEMFSGIAENLIDYTFNMTSYEMNDVMRRLTLATIICLPLTLLTGYFGMNFTPMWSVQQNSDLLFWKIALPLMAVVVPLSLSSDIKRAYQYLTQKKQSDRASRRVQGRKYKQL
ncbi:hypothetical protein K435DRAFT_819335 [Dendrothele bispora CBS 962.96]|uniref:Cora-domain-containing protein n=1 Tax=Dendrothele bispora (strain CBS 962.96) TaxID=1314807 RepID=A0A4S8M4J3_DENBC|nr:hypothetical protein K435DRAFT_819335 [Dendrothele bispora CBS 962.96]